QDREAGIKVLHLIQPDASVQQIEAKADEILAISHEKVEAGRFWTRRLRVPILLAFLIAFFNQLSGINAILYFAPRIFEMTGLGTKAALLQSVGIGITNLLFTFVGLWLIDRLGRRTLLSTFFPRMVSAFPPGYVFSFFAFMMVLQLIWVKTMVPETKGVPLEEIEHRLTGTPSPQSAMASVASASPAAQGGSVP